MPKHQKKTNDSNKTLNVEKTTTTADTIISGNTSKSVPVAVIGVGALFPGSADPGGYWRDILNGRDLIIDAPESHWLINDHYDPDPFAKDKAYAKTGAFLSPTEFNPMEFGIPPTNLPATDTAQLLGLIVAKQVLNDAANGQFKDMNRDRISVVLGVAAGLELLGEIAGRLQRPLWVKALREEGFPESRVNEICDRILSNFVEWKESTFPGLLGNVVAGRIANYFDLGGMNCTSDAACASSFSAMKMALDELYLGESDVVITGGVDTANGPFLYTCFSKTPALSMTGDSRPFSEDADGMILGEGIGMVALKRLDDAERDGDRIYGIIKGIGASSDGAGTSVYAPAASGQVKALDRAYHSAGYGPETVELVEAHGTATSVGDKVELEALNKVFNSSDRKDRQWCALGSVKSQIGHTKSSAAVAGLIKAIMAVHHKILPPTIKVKRPNPKFKIETTPFYVNTKSRPWITHGDYPRRASVSSFGFGGTNFHVTLEEYKGEGKTAYRMRTNPNELVFFTAKNSEELIASCETTLLESIDAKGLLYYLARTSQENLNEKHPCRLGIIADDEKDLADKLSQAKAKIAKNPETAFSFPNGIFYNPSAKDPGQTAFLFSGQGSQYVDMGKDIAMFDNVTQNIWDMSASIPMDGETLLSDVVFPKPVFSDEHEKALTKRLTQTEWAQPAICTTSLTMLEILKQANILPDCVAGHSLGEVSALHAAGVIDKEGLIKIARKRGELMAKASAKKGAMTAVAEPSEKIEGLLKTWNTGVIIANHNSPKQVVLSGALDEIENVEKKLNAEGIKTHRLPVSTAFHSSLMTDSCEPFKTFIDSIDFKPQLIPIYSNADAKPYDKKSVRETLTKQINHPVRFVEQIDAMYQQGVRTFIEVGPGGILTKLVDQCLEGRPHTSVSMDKKGAHGITSLWKALGQLAVNGISINFSALWDSYAPAEEDPRKKKKPLMTVLLSGHNYGRPYPPAGGANALPKPNPEEKKSEIIPLAAANIQAPKESTTMQLNQTAFKKEIASEDNIHSIPKSIPQPPRQEASQTQSGKEEKYYNIKQPAHPSIKPRSQRPAPAISQASLSTIPQGSPSWLNAFQEIQRHTAETYSSFQKNLAETYIAFLHNSEETNRMLGNMVTGQGMGHREPARVYDYASPNLSYSQPTEIVQESRYQQTTPVQQQTVPVQAKTQPVAVKPQVPEARAEKKAAAPQNQTMAPAASIDYEAMIMNVVSEKTGYPKDILTFDMGLEADLGIDSIKRVEIFSAVKDENPWMPEVDPSEMGDIQTLGDVLEFIKTHANAANPSPASDVPVTAAPTSGAGVPVDIDFEAMLLDVVADKTGYPKDILTLEMGLEADLGIDSIKRVEIFSAVKDDNPWMPEVDPSEMGDIQTLGDVLEFIKENAKAVGPAPSSNMAPSAAQTSLPSVPADIDFEAMLLNVVADKTGYPKDILNLDMGLEADLGIDSIKRVEIFSAVKDDNPWMPEVDPSEMGDIQTLGDVLEFIKSHAAASTSGSPKPMAQHVDSAPAMSAAAPANVDFEKMLLEVVAEKTGYPLDILQLDMGLEADLGIDSIKRVEIFSAVKDENPWMPEVDPSEMGDIQTLGDVLLFIENHAKGLNKATPMTETAETVSEDLATGKKPSGIGRYALREVSMPHSGFKMTGLNPKSSIIITNDNNGVAEALVSKLKKKNLKAQVSDTIPNDTDVLIFLGGLRDCPDEDSAISINKEAFLSAQKVSAKLTESGGIFVTVQDTGGDFGLSGTTGHRAYLGGLPGLVKTASLEWPKASVKAIDIDRSKKTADLIADEITRELFTGGPEKEVAIHADGSRYTLESYAADPNPSDVIIDKSSVIIASGGARGVTAATLIELAKKVSPHIVLLGRTPIEQEPPFTRNAKTDADLKRVLLENAREEGISVTPALLGSQTKKILAGREINETLSALSAAGSEARYITCDVRDADSINAALAPIRDQWGPVTGIVHGAGVLTDKLIAEKTEDQFNLVFNTKVEGLRSLLRATNNDPINMICLFSSIAARSGNFGQCDYAMANEILNKVATVEKNRRKGACVVKSLNWGPWDGGMVSPLLKEYFGKMGVPLIPLDEGSQRMVEEVMEGSQASVEIVIGPCPPASFFSAISEKHEASLHLMINKNDYPFIDNHRIKDEPVVPVAMVLEWFSRAAHVCRPDLDFVSCKDLTVLQGIKLNDFSHNGDRITCKCCQISNGNGSILEIEIPGKNGSSHYKGTIEMAEKGASLKYTAASENIATQLSNWDWDTTQIYTEKLFHGPDFHVIKKLEGVSETAATAVLHGIDSMNWPGASWKTDAAAIDGGLQLAILWGMNQVGKQSLPTKIGSYFNYMKNVPNGPIYCELHGKIIDNNRTISDISFFNEKKEILAQMQGVEMHMLAN
ncbi:MAG: SDR family oxidoreductase [Proteobacteria bacterium]|nr:SDR family oxidoreductase [Pseudomonadota bacterium]